MREFEFKIMFITFFMSFNVYSQLCPVIKNPPACPETGIKILDETYPIKLFVMKPPSHDPVNRIAQKAPSKTIIELITAHDLESIPLIVTPFFKNEENSKVFNQTLHDIKEELLKRNYTQETIESKILPRIKMAEDKSGKTFLQDYMQSYFNPTTGGALVSSIVAHNIEAKNTSKAISDVGSSCSVELGPDIEKDPDNYFKPNSFSGGGIEALPGGLCMVEAELTNTKDPLYPIQFCGKKENIIPIDASWMYIGHVDEIIKVTPSFADNSDIPNKCKFSILTASPLAALRTFFPNRKSEVSFDQIKMNELVTGMNANSPLFGFQGTAEEEQEYYNQFLNRGHNGLLDILCTAHLLKNKAPGNLKDPQDEKVKSALLFIKKILQSLSVPQAYANSKPSCKLTENDLKGLTTKDFMGALISNPDFLTHHRLLQETMDKNSLLIQRKLIGCLPADVECKKDLHGSGRLPECAPYFDRMKWEVPNLFSNSSENLMKDESGGPAKLWKPGMTQSIFPNPTNGISANSTYIIPKPHVKFFEESLEKEAKSRGIKYKAIDTYAGYHLGAGNLHCATNSFQVCTPKRSK